MDQPQITIISPCYNEGATVVRFLDSLCRELEQLPYCFRVLMADDCSSDNTGTLLSQYHFAAENVSLEVVSLPQNVGHQAAIYEGLVLAAQHSSDHFIVMDSDGQDAPSVIGQLLQHMDSDIVHVVRSRRSESIGFRLSYYTYRAIFRLATGRQMNFGNFCMISRDVAACAVHARFSHLAAFLAKQQGKFSYVTAERQARIGGRSKMSFSKLVEHALRSFAEYGYDRRIRMFKRTMSR